MDANTNSDVHKAEDLKLKANEAFKANKFSLAKEMNSQAIELNNSNAIYWANRNAYAKIEEYGREVVKEATKAIEIDPKCPQGYIRRGAAYLAIGKFNEAMNDLQMVKNICPNDPDAVRKLKECVKAFHKLCFHEAICVGDAERRSVADSTEYHIIDGKNKWDQVDRVRVEVQSEQGERTRTIKRGLAAGYLVQPNPNL